MECKWSCSVPGRGAMPKRMAYNPPRPAGLRLIQDPSLAHATGVISTLHPGSPLDFASPIFLFLFFPLFILVYHLAGQRAKLAFGILGSLLFYAWGNLVYVPLMIAVTLASYGLGHAIVRWRGSRRGAAYLWGGSFGIVALLLLFKLIPGLAYPLGLSYLGFQALAYLFEVNQGRVSADWDLLRFSFYLLLFPKLPVGPITRYGQVQPQFADLRADPASMADGLRRFIRGLAKKVLIADTLAKVVDPIFSLAAPTISPDTAWLVILSYALQIFFDFSGYTDMAIGLGRMLGLTFPENFNFPYLAHSIADFWRRWHITLYAWFRDFVFYPLERRRLKWIGQPLNILVVFLLVGLWHGIGPGFIIWGLIQGVALIFESTLIGKKVTALPAPFRNLYALLIILVGWVFFRSATPQFAIEFLQRLAGDARGLTVLPFDLTNPLPIIEPTFVMAFAAGLLFCFPIGRWIQTGIDRLAGGLPLPSLAGRILYDGALIVMLLAAIAATATSSFRPGIYAKF